MIQRPLKPQWFQILLALAPGDRHGTAVQRAVLEQTDGHMRLWPAMLYRSLTRLERDGLIRSADPPGKEIGDERRKYYSLTDRGREVLAEEADMLGRWVEAARAVRPT